jgi:hypothetical protein
MLLSGLGVYAGPMGDEHPGGRHSADDSSGRLRRRTTSSALARLPASSGSVSLRTLPPRSPRQEGNRLAPQKWVGPRRRPGPIFVTVDEKHVPVSKKKNRADTPLFRVTLPKNSIFGGPPTAPAGKYKGVADGVRVLLPPLEKGKCTITFGGTFPNADLDPNKPGPEGFSQNNTYKLTVV